MAEMAQTMFGDSVDAFVNQNATEAESQDLVFRKISSLHEQLTERVNTELAGEEKISPEVATSLILVGRSLEIIGERSLDIANHVVRLYSEETDQHLEDLQAEAE
jgi:phosphate uptake regulator